MAEEQTKRSSTTSYSRWKLHVGSGQIDKKSILTSKIFVFNMKTIISCNASPGQLYLQE